MRNAIANSHLLSADEASVTFRWRDYHHDDAPRQISLHPHEFIRRFLIHSLPDGFHRICHYGLPPNGCRRARLATVRQILIPKELIAMVAAQVGDAPKPIPHFDPTQCPCRGGVLRVTAKLPRWRTVQPRLWIDTYD